MSRPTSVAVPVIASLVLVATVALLALGTVNHRNERRQEHEALGKRTRTEADQLAVALVLPLWNFDRAQINRVLESAMTPAEIAGVEVRQDDVSAPGGTLVHARGRDQAWRSVATGTLAAEAPGDETDGGPPVVEERVIRTADTRLGSLRILATPRFVERDLRLALVELVARILLVDLVLVVSLFLLLWRVVLRPLKAVERFAVAASAGEPGQRLAVAPRFEGELETLRASIERTIGLLDERYVELQQNRAMLSLVLNSIPQGVFWKDAESVYLGCNEVFARHAGLTGPAEVVGKTDFDLSWRKDAETYRKGDREVIRTRQPHHRVFERVVAADGTVLWIDAIKVPLVGPDGAARGVLGVLEDVTERKLAEQEIRRMNAELEGRVRERTSELVAANRELEAFSFTVSHDLRAPLRIIAGFARMLREEHARELGPEPARMIAVIDRNTRLMGALIDDLLLFARLSRQPLRKQRTEVLPLVEASLEQARASEAPGRRVEVSVGPLEPCEADPGLLQQVFANLVANAFKYTRGRDPARIEIGSLPGTTPDERVYFVRDNGTGFDMKDAGKLFGVFQRLHRAAEYEGTGVGLAIVERVVARHGGRVWAEAEADRGATFYLAIRAAPAEPRARQPTSA